MARRSACLAILLAAVSLATTPAVAHHSFAAYDSTRTMALTGTVETFQWANPHVQLGLLTEGTDGRPETRWAIESSSPGILGRFGWRRDSVKRGDRVVAEFNPMIDGSHAGRLHILTFVGSGKVLNTKLSVCLARLAHGQRGLNPDGRC